MFYLTYLRRGGEGEEKEEVTILFFPEKSLLIQDEENSYLKTFLTLQTVKQNFNKLSSNTKLLSEENQWYLIPKNW